jgi:hypothetical protein
MNTLLRTISNQRRRSPVVALLAALSVCMLVGGAATSAAQGTAKPPPRAVAPFIEPTLSNPVFSVAPTGIHNFTELGFLQHATVDGAGCANGTPASNFGGTAVINNVTIIVPCNMTIQMPANTLTWADFVNQAPPLALDGAPAPYPSFELQVFGNIVGPSPVTGRHIAGLMFFSQQSLNAGTGYISSINYTDGSFLVDQGGGSPVKVQLNDPKITTAGDPANGTGRYSAGQSPDPRLSVDQNNPTVKTGTGYPMCIPRTDPAAGDDPKCPKVNRPVTPGATAQAGVSQGCRNFAQAGVQPPTSGELTAPFAGQIHCSEFVTPDPARRGPTDPDATQQTPFEVGDHVVYAGTLIKNADGSQFVSAHTVTADISVFTQPGTTPSYLAIDGSLIGSADPLLTAITGVPQEPKDRLVVVIDTTDVKAPVDIYLPDIDPTTGRVRNRWVTPEAMTGENNAPNGGGITTQNAGPQPQRARLRANKSPAGLLSNPTRTIRVSNRVTCVPNSPSGHNFDGTSSTVTLTPVDTCLRNVPVRANGLQAGVYTAPTFNFIFPENTRHGDLLVPSDFWHLGFLRFGEGPNPITPAVGPLQPQPW